MSADNGYILRPTKNGRFALQMHSASADGYPPVQEDKPDAHALFFDSVDEAVEYHSKNNDWDGGLWSEYGLTVDRSCYRTVSKKRTQEAGNPFRPNKINNQENTKMDIQKYTRVPFTVEAVQVTEENMLEIAKWCGGKVAPASSGYGAGVPAHVQVDVKHPLNRRQTQGWVGDWVLKSGARSFKVYLEGAFQKSFVKELTVSEAWDKVKQTVAEALSETTNFTEEEKASALRVHDEVFGVDNDGNSTVSFNVFDEDDKPQELFVTSEPAKSPVSAKDAIRGMRRS